MQDVKEAMAWVATTVTTPGIDWPAEREAVGGGRGTAHESKMIAMRLRSRPWYVSCRKGHWLVWRVGLGLCGR